MCTVTAK